MHLLVRRYNRSGYAAPWFLYAAALGFVALTVWGAVQGDWLVMILAALAAIAAVALVPVTRRLSAGLRASQQEIDGIKEGRHG
jgi:hypothetical protein